MFSLIIHRSSGMILFTTLVFLFVLTLLVLTMINSTLLEVKMTDAFIKKWQVNAIAESGLIVGLAKILGKPLPAIHSRIHLQYRYKVIKITRCFVFYLLKSEAMSNLINVKLLAEFKIAKMPRVAPCQPQAPPVAMIAWHRL